jgi:hypothetical protein
LAAAAAAGFGAAARPALEVAVLVAFAVAALPVRSARRPVFSTGLITSPVTLLLIALLTAAPAAAAPTRAISLPSFMPAPMWTWWARARLAILARASGGYKGRLPSRRSPWS